MNVEDRKSENLHDKKKNRQTQKKQQQKTKKEDANPEVDVSINLLLAFSKW